MGVGGGGDISEHQVGNQPKKVGNRCFRAFAQYDHYVFSSVHLLRRSKKLSMTLLHTDREMALSFSLMASLRSVTALGFPE